MRRTGLHKNPAGGKGLYLAIAVSAVAVGAVAWLASAGLEQEPVQPEQVASLPASQAAEQVTVSREDVPKTENFVVSYPVSQAESSVPASEEVSQEVEETIHPVSDVPSEASSGPESGEQGWMMPVEGARLTNPYSGGELVKSRTLGEWRTHDGIDLSAAAGEPVKAAADGTVKDVRMDSRWGYVVEVEHGDVTAYYCGLGEELKVKAGQQVKQGDVLGAAGNSSVLEASEEPHLHLGMKRDGKWIDPAEVLGL